MADRLTQEGLPFQYLPTSAAAQTDCLRQNLKTSFSHHTL